MIRSIGRLWRVSLNHSNVSIIFQFILIYICSSNYFKKNSTPFLLYIYDMHIAVTKKIEFSEAKKKKKNYKQGEYNKTYYCALEYKFCFGLQIDFYCCFL